MSERAFNPAAVTTWQRVSAAATLLGLVFLFFRSYSYTSTSTATGHSVVLYSVGSLGWHYIGLWFPSLLIAAVVGLDVVRTQRPALVASIPISTRLVAAGVGVFATVCLLVQVFTLSSSTVRYSGGTSSQGPSFGAYLVLVAGIAATVGVVMELRTSGEPVPRVRLNGSRDVTKEQ